MIQTTCSKCGADLLLRDGYCVCNSCGEIYRCIDDEEEVLQEEETVEEMPVVEENPVMEEQIQESEPEEVFVPYAEDPKVEVEQNSKEETEDEPAVEEEEEEEPTVAPAPVEVSQKPKKADKKKSKAPIVIIILLLICAGAVAGWYFMSGKSGQETSDDNGIEAVEPIIEEEPEEIIEEEMEEEAEEPLEEPETVAVPEPTPTPAPAPTPAPVVKEEPKEETPAPAPTEQPAAIAYRIRKSADDKDSQIGAFADLNRAKAFADAHAAEGYKVFDLEGNLVYQP